MERIRRRALVTGGRRGLGQAIAAALARDGHDLVIVDVSLRGAEETQRLVEAAGGACATFQADLEDVEAIGRLAHGVMGQHGGVDVLVNNAAINNGKGWQDVGYDEWDRTLAVNLRAPLALVRELAPGMAERGWGRIINIGSLAGAGIGGGATDYAVAKAGLQVIGRILARDLGPSGITVNTVAPGTIETEWVLRNIPEERRAAGAAANPARRNGRPEDIAETVAFLASDRAGFINGQTIHVNGGQYMS